jgi:uncharacterized protein (TIGR00296 family)
MSELSQSEGKKILKAARDSVVAYFGGKTFKLSGFPQKRGVFVTLHSHPSHALRGCIGFPEPIFSVNDGLPKAAVCAAFQDPRFNALDKSELSKVIFEVSILTEPELVKVKKPGDYFSKIKVGVDGLIVEKGYARGLLLPIVAKEYGWSVEQFLEETCSKAGLSHDSWKDVKDCRVFKFQAQVFSENKPV